MTRSCPPQTYAEPPAAVLFCGLIYAKGLDLGPVLQRLMEEWGDLEFISRRIGFRFSTYYDAEMGNELFRKFLTFRRTVSQDSLPRLKRISGEVERTFLGGAGGRTVNVDPGLLLPERLVLATTKPGSHRPYLGQGIYADLTLVFHQKSYQPLGWTYPDYRARETIVMMNRLRIRHRTRWDAEGSFS